jgi:hypothetical protein
MTLYITRPIGFHAFIRTTINLEVYSDPECTIPLTIHDYGDYGAGEKNFYAYIKNLGNDVIHVCYNLTSGTNWVQIADHYTDGVFEFAIFTDQYSVWNPNAFINIPYNGIQQIWLKCWTSAFLPYDTSWTIGIYGYF